MRRGSFEVGDQVYNETRGTTIATSLSVARSFMARGKGLMGKREFSPGEALLIDPCSSIHMFFMRFPIDVLYMDREHRVVRVQHGIKPWRVGPLFTRGARYVIELPAGVAERSGTQVGDRILYQTS